MAGTTGERAIGHPEEAVDRDPRSRPGVPMLGGPAPESSLVARAALEPQPVTVEVLTSVEVGRLTPVFGTTLPPRGLSGVLRRLAYRRPEHRAGRWLLLMVGDRVDVWESRVRRHPALSVVAVLGLVWLATRRRR